MKAASIHFPDPLQTRGECQQKPALPFTLGMELAGQIVKLAKASTAGRSATPWSAAREPVAWQSTPSPALALRRKPEAMTIAVAKVMARFALLHERKSCSTALVS